MNTNNTLRSLALVTLALNTGCVGWIKDQIHEAFASEMQAMRQQALAQPGMPTAPSSGSAMRWNSRDDEVLAGVISVIRAMQKGQWFWVDDYTKAFHLLPQHVALASTTVIVSQFQELDEFIRKQRPGIPALRAEVTKRCDTIKDLIAHAGHDKHVAGVATKECERAKKMLEGKKPRWIPRLPELPKPPKSWRLPDWPPKEPIKAI